VLNGVDGLVFVADSMEVRRKRNILSLKNLNENLQLHMKNIKKIPMVMQYNKIDLRDKGIELIDFKTLEKDLNSDLKAPSFAASALTGQNVVNTLKKIVSLTMSNLKNEFK
jgi:hypothetical protein